MEEFEATTKMFAGEVPTEVIDIASLGEGFSLVKNSKVNFTQELAQKILMYEAVPWERDLKNPHVSFLISEMKKGTFLHELATLATCVCDDDGKEYRVNGQHTSWARLEVTEKEVPAKPIRPSEIQGGDTSGCSSSVFELRPWGGADANKRHSVVSWWNRTV